MDVTVMPFVFPGVANVRCAFQTRCGGAGGGAYAGGNISFSVGDERENVAANRRSLQRVIGVEHRAELNQVHGDMLIFDPQVVADDGRPETEADGMATSKPQLALMIKTADCQPLLLAHTSGKYIAALHVGWRGNRHNFPASGVRRFCARYGLSPHDVLAVRGPSLGPEMAEFVNFGKEWGPEFVPWFDVPSRTVDLWSLTRDQLVAVGLLPRHIYGLDLCTASNTEQFFSYRREKICGRQCGLIWIEN